MAGHLAVVGVLAIHGGQISRYRCVPDVRVPFVSELQGLRALQAVRRSWQAYMHLGIHSLFVVPRETWPACPKRTGARAFAGMVKERQCRFRTALAPIPKIGRVVFPGYKDLTSGNALLREDHVLCWEK